MYDSDVRVCPNCGKSKGSRIEDSGTNSKQYPYLYRRRICQYCGKTWSTFELHVEDVRALEKARKDIYRMTKEIWSVMRSYQNSAESEKENGTDLKEA